MPCLTLSRTLTYSSTLLLFFEFTVVLYACSARCSPHKPQVPPRPSHEETENDPDGTVAAAAITVGGGIVVVVVVVVIHPPSPL